MKPNKSFRIDPALLEKAKKQKLNITKVFEAALAKALGDNKCPFCNGEIKNEK